MSIGNLNPAGSWQGMAAGAPLEQHGVGGMATGLDPVEAYFECITSCSLDDGECITTCTTILREQP